MSCNVGSSKVRFTPPRYEVIPPMGDQACVRMLVLGVQTLERGLLEVRVDSIWFTAGTTEVSARRRADARA